VCSWNFDRLKWGERVFFTFLGFPRLRFPFFFLFFLVRGSGGRVLPLL